MSAILPGTVPQSVTRRGPFKFSQMRMGRDTREGIERIAIGIFTAMVNNGQTMQAALCAVYLSGVEHGISGGTDGNGESGQ